MLSNHYEVVHSGINMSHIRVGGGAAGFLFSASTVFIFIAGIPEVRWFPAVAFGVGVLISLALGVYHSRRPKRAPISILK